MDSETKSLLTSVFEHLELLIEQAADAQAVAYALRLMLAERDDEFQQSFLKHYSGHEVTEIKLRVSDELVPIRALIQRLKA